VEEDGGYRVSKRYSGAVCVRAAKYFERPPFSRMDLISCRNLLIYLEAGAQKRILPAFHYALKPQGFLFLGASESVGAFPELFESADKQQKIFSKKPGPAPVFHLPDSRSHSAIDPQVPAARSGGGPGEIRAEPSAQREADRVTLRQFGRRGYWSTRSCKSWNFGFLRAYFELPAGEASFDVIRLAREGLRLPLRAALNKAKQKDQTVREENVQIRQNGETRTVDLQIIPLKNSKSAAI